MGIRDLRAMAGPANTDRHTRASVVHWIEAARTEESAQGFARCFVDGIHADPAAAPSYLARLGDLSWPVLTALIADFAHFFEIAHHGWPASALGIISRDIGLTGESDHEAVLGAALADVKAMHGLAIAVGSPSLIGGLTNAETAARANHMQLQTLLLSERRGCALGTVIAMALAWQPTAHTINGIIRLCRDRDGKSDLPLMSADTPHPAGSSRLVDYLGAIADSITIRRGLLFGATQALAIRADLWALLARRASMVLAAHA